MRSFFAEDDLISAEVQKLNHDGAIALHTRNEKYGKLVGGQVCFMFCYQDFQMQ